MSNSLATVERQRRELASAVKRLRVAVMTDHARSGEFADALVGLVGNRLQAWSFAQAAADAPESVVLSARILAERGPMGPYASVDDAVRYFTAAAQLAAVQAALGQAEAAGRTVDSLDAWRGQLGQLPLLENLDPETVVWTLIARGRSLLAGDVAGANAHAEAALLRLYAARLDIDPEFAYLAMATHLLAADARWAAGDPELALAHHRLALRRYQAVAARPCDQARPAVVEATLAPLAELYAPFAQRLEAIGDQVSGVAVRRAWSDTFDDFEQPDDDPASLVAFLALREALARAGRVEEAEGMGVKAGDFGVHPAGPGEPVAWEPLPWEQAYSDRMLTVTAVLRLRRDEAQACAAAVEARKEAEGSEAQERAAAERWKVVEDALRAEGARLFAELAAAEAEQAAEAARREAEALATRRAAEEAVLRAAAEQRRAELAAERERTVDPESVRAAAAELPAARLAVDQAGAESVRLWAAHERLAELLRPLATADPHQYREELTATLDTLVSLRWKLGDPEGSREAARERKTWH